MHQSAGLWEELRIWLTGGWDNDWCRDWAREGGLSRAGTRGRVQGQSWATNPWKLDQELRSRSSLFFAPLTLMHLVTLPTESSHRDFRLPLQWCLTAPSASILPPSVSSRFLANLSLESPLPTPVTLIKCILLNRLVSGLQRGPRGITPCSSATLGGPYRARRPTPQRVLVLPQSVQHVNEGCSPVVCGRQIPTPTVKHKGTGRLSRVDVSWHPRQGPSQASGKSYKPRSSGVWLHLPLPTTLPPSLCVPQMSPFPVRHLASSRSWKQVDTFLINVHP